MDCVESDGSFESQYKHGYQVFYREWKKPNVSPRALVILSHGFGDHSGRMRDVAQHFCQKNYITTCIDFVGMGKSDGVRGLVRTVDHYMNDLVQHTRQKQHEHPDLPTFLVGHSMGSHVAIRTVIFYPDLYTGIISSAAPLTINPRLVTPLRYMATKFLARFFPQVVVQRFDQSRMSRDSSVTKSIEKDELSYRGGLKAGWCYAMYFSLLYVIEHMEKITTPILALHGSADVICETKGSRDLISRVSSKDKTLKLYDGAYHSLFLEPAYKEDVIADCIHWIEDRIHTNEAEVEDRIHTNEAEEHFAYVPRSSSASSSA